MDGAHDLQFGPFRLAPGDERLWRGAEAIVLRPKSFAVLRYLVERAGRLVTKEELAQAVWPGLVVSEAALTVCVGEIRKALGDEPHGPQFIATVHRRGYRFIGPVVGPASEVRSVEAAGMQSPEAGSHEERSLVSLRPRSLYLTPVGMVGRETALQRMHGWLAKARRGERQVGLVTGEAGIGKTTVVDAFLAQAAREPTLWLARGQCIDQHGAGEAYLPVLDALQQLCRAPGGEQLLALLGQQAPTWLVQLPALLDQAALEAVQRRVLGATRERMLRELADVVEALTADRPLVLVLEDLHWSDAATLDLVAYLARRRERAQLLVLGTYRPVEAIVRGHPLRAVTQELALHRQCEELALELLSEAEVAQYLAVRFGGETVPASLARLLYERTEGHPLFMVAMVDEWVRQGWLVEGGGPSAGPAGLTADAVGVPESLRAMIERQLDQLSAEDQRVLEAASVMGMACSAAAVAADVEAAVEAVEEQCARLARRGQFLQASGVEEWPDGAVAGRYTFRHALYQQVVYAQLPAARRRGLHQRIGARVEAGYGAQAGERAAELAGHFERGGDAGRTVTYRRQAAAHALQRWAYQEAVGHLEQALAALRHLPESRETREAAINVRLDLRNALMPLGEWGRIFNYLQDAETLAHALNDRWRLAQVSAHMTHHFLIMGRHDRAIASGQRTLAIAEALGDFALQVQVKLRLGQAHRALGDNPRAIEILRQVVTSLEGERIREHFGLLGLPSVFSRGVLVMCLAELGRFAEGIACGDEAVRIAEAIDQPYSLTWAYAHVGELYLVKGDFPKAIPVLERGLERCQIADIPALLPRIASALGCALALSGRVAEALPLLQQAVEEATSTGRMGFHSSGVTWLGQAYLLAGERDKAIPLALRALDLARIHQERGHLAWIFRLLGDIAAPRQPLEAAPAEGHYRQALALAEELGMRPLQAHCHLGLGVLYRHIGRLERARAELSTAIELYRGMAMTFWRRRAETALAQVEGG